MAQELAQGIDSGGHGLNTILMVDMEKAFDKLSW
jgi:hypothetical protein